MTSPRGHPPRVERFAQRVTLPRAVSVIVVASAAFTLAAAAAERIVEPETFRSYPGACWWAIQTVSSVGYGDQVPHSAAGRVVATLVMLFGLAFVPAITSIVVAILLQRHRGGQASQADGEDPVPGPGLHR